MTETLLSINNFNLSFTRKHNSPLPVLNDINLHIDSGEVVGVIGESASGKSTLAMSVMGLHDKGDVQIDGGEILWRGKNLLSLDEAQFNSLRGADIAMVFQDPMTSLDPLIPIVKQVVEVIKAHRQLDTLTAKQEALQLLQRVGIDGAMAQRRPFELSGGQRQRVLISMAVANKPKLIIADEPTTALDASLQNEVLDLLKELSQEVGAAILLITHDLGVIAHMADRVYVMYAGQVVETATKQELFQTARMPYSWGLLQSAPQSIDGPRIIARSIRGTPPTLSWLPQGCRFHPRCDYAQDRCLTEAPALTPLADSHAARCHFATQSDWQAPAIESVSALRPTPQEQPAFHVVGLRKVFGRGEKAHTAVNDVELNLYRGEILAIVGESGCGKTTLGKLIVRLLMPTAGQIFLGGRQEENEIDLNNNKDLREYRRKVQLVFQDPFASLNPRMKIIDTVAEPLRMAGSTKQESLTQAAELLLRCGIQRNLHNLYPHQFSGGQRQRVGIARALVVKPDIVVLDEPVSALDVSIQAQILNLLRDIQREMHTSFIFISHDLAVVRQLSDRTAVMYRGEIVELADTDTLFVNPQHEYTKQLLAAIPSIDSSLSQHNVASRN